MYNKELGFLIVICYCAQSQLGVMEEEVQSLITAREKKIEEIQMSLVNIQVCLSAPFSFYLLMYTFSPGLK